MDRWTTYAVRAAAIVLIVWFGYQGIQRIVVDHVRALQRVQQQKARIERDGKKLQTISQQKFLCETELAKVKK